MEKVDIERIFELNSLIRSAGARGERERAILPEVLLSHTDRTYLGLCGPRGAGKTVLLKQYLLRNRDSLYLSLDTMPADFDLFEAIKTISQSYGVKTFLLDEVHFHRSIDAHLKSCFDFLDVQVIFTSSIALQMFRSAQDLSRRVKLVRVPYFSLREYLLFKHGEVCEPLTLNEVLTGPLRPGFIVTDRWFREYLNGGLLPFALEVRDWREALSNTVKRVVLEDIPRVYPISLEETEVIFKVLRFIGVSPIDGINPSSIAKNLAITFFKAEQYLSLLERAFIVRRIAPRGTNVLKEPKVVLSPPYRLLYSDSEHAIGGLREDFAVDALSRIGAELNYIKSERGKKLPDYVVQLGGESIVLEIGGRSKGAKQLRAEDRSLARFIFKEGPPYDSLFRPLSALGLLESEGER